MNVVHPSYCEIAHVIVDVVDYAAADVAAAVCGGKSHLHLLHLHNCHWNWWHKTHSVEAP